MYNNVFLDLPLLLEETLRQSHLQLEQLLQDNKKQEPPSKENSLTTEATPTYSAPSTNHLTTSYQPHSLNYNHPALPQPVLSAPFYPWLMTNGLFDPNTFEHSSKHAIHPSLLSHPLSSQHTSSFKSQFPSSQTSQLISQVPPSQMLPSQMPPSQGCMAQSSAPPFCLPQIPHIPPLQMCQVPPSQMSQVPQTSFSKARPKQSPTSQKSQPSSSLTSQIPFSQISQHLPIYQEKPQLPQPTYVPHQHTESPGNSSVLPQLPQPTYVPHQHTESPGNSSVLSTNTWCTLPESHTPCENNSNSPITRPELKIIPKILTTSGSKVYSRKIGRSQTPSKTKNKYSPMNIEKPSSPSEIPSQVKNTHLKPEVTLIEHTHSQGNRMRHKEPHDTNTSTDIQNSIMEFKRKKCASPIKSCTLTNVTQKPISLNTSVQTEYVKTIGTQTESTTVQTSLVHDDYHDSERERDNSSSLTNVSEMKKISNTRKKDKGTSPLLPMCHLKHVNRPIAQDKWTSPASPIIISKKDKSDNDMQELFLERRSSRQYKKEKDVDNMDDEDVDLLSMILNEYSRNGEITSSQNLFKDQISSKTTLAIGDPLDKWHDERECKNDDDFLGDDSCIDSEDEIIIQELFYI